MTLRTVGRAASLLFLSLASTAFTAPALAQTPAEVLEGAKRVLNLTDGAVVTLDIDRTFGRAVAIAVPIEGQLHTLELVPNSIRTPDYRLLEVGADGVARPAKAGVENSLVGRIADIPGSEIAGGMMPEGLYCTILMPDGSRYWIESIEGRVPGAPIGAHAIYRAGDIVRGGHECGGTIEPAPSFIPRTVFQPRNTTLYTATVACDADFDFWAEYGSTSLVQARITLVINTMNLQFRRDVNIKHLVGTILVRTAAGAPYTSTFSTTLLTQFRTEWETNQTGITRQIATLFTGKSISDGNRIGLAWAAGQVCTDQAYCFVWSNFNRNLSSATDLSAHELGHLWGACHCACDSPTRVGRYTMNPAITSINRFGPGGADSDCGDDSVAEITAYRATRYAGAPNGPGCLGTTAEGENVVNDSCANAIPLANSVIMAMGNIFSTTDGPPSSCRVQAGKDIWYSFIAPCDGTLTLDTCSSSFDTVLTIYTGSCGALTEVPGGCNDDAEAGNCVGTNASRVSCAVTRATTYRIKVSGFNNATGLGYLFLSMTGCQQDINDGCTWVEEVLNGVPEPFTTLGATTDGNADILCDHSGNSQLFQDVWFLYQTIPCTGPVRVSTCDADFDTRIAVYHTGCPNADTAFGCNDDDGPACSGTRASLIFNAEVGHTYVIRIGGYLSATGTGTLLVESLNCPRPANDDCAAATTVVNGSSITSNFYGATNDGAATCGSSTESRDIWFNFTAPAGGTLTLTTCGTHDTGGVDTGVDTVLSVHSGCPGDTSNQLAGGCADDNAGQCGGSDAGVLRDSHLTCAMTFGQNVKIRLANYNNATPANKQVKLNVSFKPANDNCASAITIGEGLASWYNSNATTDGPQFPGGGCGVAGLYNDVWYRYIPTCTGNARVSLCITPFDTVLAVYSGSCGALGLPLACNDDNGPACAGAASSVDFAATAGQPYLIRMGSFNPAESGQGLRGVYCTPLGGACCNGTTCSVLAAAACVGANTHFAGNGTVCNAPGVNTTPCCRADFNQSGTLEVQDIFDYLNAWFAGTGAADFNGAGLAVQDIFDYLNAWFAGC